MGELHKKVLLAGIYRIKKRMYEPLTGRESGVNPRILLNDETVSLSQNIFCLHVSVSLTL